MRYGKVEGLEKPVSRMCLGSMIITRQKPEESFALLDAAVAQGVNTIDTANVYAGGESERCIGQWLEARGNREQVVILTKGCHHDADRKRATPYDLTADLMTSLARLRTDYVDIYLLHRDDPAQPVGPIVETLNEHRAAGRLRAGGGSNWTHERLAEANEYAYKHNLAPMVVSSPNFSLAEQVDNPWGEGCVGLGGESGAAGREFYRRTGLAVFAYSSLARGLFSGRLTRENYREVADGACQRAYCHEVNFRRLDRLRELAAGRNLSVPQLALAWVLSQELNVFALVGAATPTELAANAAVAETILTPEECAWLDLRAEAVETA